MKSFKQIIMENPDGVVPSFGETEMGFREARYTFIIYHDALDKEDHWIAYDYFGCKILTSNTSLHNELYITKSHPNYDRVLREMDDMLSFPAHTGLRTILTLLGRCHQESILDGRLFKHNLNWYFPFWQLGLFKFLNKYRSLIDDFLKVVNVSTDSVEFEDENTDGIFHSYETVFGKKQEPKDRTPSDEQRRMKQMQLDLHLNKAVLDKAIVQALQSRPKNVDTLYQRLEKQLGMPIVQIKHIFGAVPLDKLIVRKAKELNESVNESVHPAVRWVGAVKHDGAVILPPNQNGDRQHYHYGLDSHQYRFSYWPYKEEVSWWNFPTDEDDLAVKVEDYLIRKGYSVKRHVDYTGRKIRDVLGESMFKLMAEVVLVNDGIIEKL